MNYLITKLEDNAFLKSLLYMVSGVVLLFLTSQITIPLKPVPITMQTTGIIIIGTIYNRKDAILSILSYLALGAIGLPMFANFSGGLYEFTGKTGGYLIGFLAAVTVMTTINEYIKKDNFFSMFINSLIGTAVIFIFGIGWLSTFIGLEKAIIFGFMPFIISGILKALITTLSIRYIKFGKFIK